MNEYAEKRLLRLMLVLVIHFLIVVFADARADVAEAASAEFVCDGGARVLPRAAVNDDFCDCRDGSDEPSTSACSGVPPGDRAFACKKGAATVAASKVNDGICDCCDGSDEIKSAVQCTFSCARQEQAALAAAEAERSALVAGLAMVKEERLQDKGAELKAQWRREHVESAKAAYALDLALGAATFGGAEEPAHEAGASTGQVGADVAARWGAVTDAGFAEVASSLAKEVAAAKREVSLHPPVERLPVIQEDGSILLLASLV